MKTIYNIGSSSENDIVIRNSDYPNRIAQINYVRGYWIISKSVTNIAVFLNKVEIQDSTKLTKYDRIKIGNHTIHWSNYLHEGKNQELRIRDFTSYNGRISLSNFRALNLLVLGLSIGVFFLPGLLQSSKRHRGNQIQQISEIQEIAPIVYTLGFGGLGLIFILLSVKRIRDTGKPIWNILIPFYNLKLLYFESSRK